MTLRKSLMADSGLLLVAFFWGTTFVIVQGAIQTLPPFIFNAWRFLCASLCLCLAIPFIRGYGQKNVTRQTLFKGGILGTLLFAGYSTQTMALIYSSASKVAFITGLSVVLVPIFAFIILREQPKLAALLGVGAATVGLYLMSIFKDLSIHAGDFLAFLCAFGFALHIIYTATFTKNESSLHLTIIQLLVVSLLSFLGGLVTDGVTATFLPESLIQPEVLWSLLSTAILATSLAYFMQTYLQLFTPATHVGLIFIMEPVFAALTAVIWQNEQIPLHVKWGSALIMIGMLLAEWPQKSHSDSASKNV
ncbi:DMT family transporter [Tuberibacillus sp. Marseille-P3662]|uniref:DMT family transporter n=1 Tax=Tuberibacillus sp. Marseille-P3662 TaxID=1965358 RepID=UPI000A1CEF10|nr:DMT family transporter [Tuberibacillus sp. Marseille-P3662]